MNTLIEEEFPLHETQSLRYDLMAALTDADLGYKLPGDNPTLGELCREMDDMEHSYIGMCCHIIFLPGKPCMDTLIISLNQGLGHSPHPVMARLSSYRRQSLQVIPKLIVGTRR